MSAVGGLRACGLAGFHRGDACDLEAVQVARHASHGATENVARAICQNASGLNLEAFPLWCRSLRPVNLERVWGLAIMVQLFACMTY